ncbi:MAG: zinc-dependent metalloprotease family protein [Saprospiraceae bacterium]
MAAALVVFCGSAVWAQDDYLQYENDDAITESPQHVEITEVSQTENELFELVKPLSYSDERGILRPDRLNRLLTQNPEERQQAIDNLSGFPAREGVPVMETGAVIQINTDLLFSSYSQLEFRIPWDSEILTVEPKSFDIESTTHWTYFGTLSGDEGQEVGYLSLIRREGKDFGRLITDDNSYLIEPLNNQNQSIILLDNRDQEFMSCGHDELTIDSEISKKIIQDQSRCTPSNEVRLLVLYTAAAEAIWDPFASATGSVALAKQALRQSDVQTSELKLIHVGTERLNEFIESGNSLTDVMAFPVWNTAPQQRADNGADIVVLLTDDSYSGVQGRVTSTQPDDPTLGTNPTTGIVDPTLNAALQGCAFVVINSPGKRNTFTHEVGHLFGGQHENTNIAGFVNVGADAFGHRWRRNFISNYRNSIMRSGPAIDFRGGGTRVLYFSNPDVSAWGEPTGVVTTAEMDRQLRAQTGLLSCYFDSPPALQASIQGPSRLELNQNYTYNSNVLNCDGPPDYLWEISRDFGPYEFLSTSASAIVSPGGSAYIVLRLTVECNGDQTVTSKTIHVDGGIPPCGQDIPCFKPQNPSSSTITSRHSPSGDGKSHDATNLFDFCSLSNSAQNLELILTNPSTGRILSRQTNIDLRTANLNSLARHQGVSGVVLASIISQEGVCSKLLFINN